MRHLCPDCGNEIAGSGLGRCQSCVVRARIRHHGALAGAHIEADWIRDLWNTFVEQEATRVSVSPPAVTKIERSLEYFLRLQAEFGHRSEITAQSISERLGRKFARQYLIASRFIVGCLDLKDYQAVSEDVAEHDRQQAIIARRQNEPFGPLLKEYANYLERHSVAIRSSRLYLRAAEALCTTQKLEGTKAWTPGTIEAFLRKKPGHAASLSRFVRFCRSEKNWNVEMSSQRERPTGVATIIKDRKNLRDILKDIEALPINRLTTRQVARILSLALGIPTRILIAERRAGKPHQRSDGTIFLTDAAIISPESPICAYACRWISLKR